MPVYDDEKEKTLAPGSHDDLGVHSERREAEADQWQKRFDGDSAEGSGKKALSSDELSRAEDEGGDSAKADDATNQESKSLGGNDGGLFKDDAESKQKGKFWTRRKKVGGGIAGLVVGGAFGIFTVASGPLQFIHIAQLLQRFHFQSLEDNGNSRILKLYKYTKNLKAGSLENSRLGIIGNRVAAKIDARYNDIGLEKKFSDGSFTASYEGMTVDPAKFAEHAQSGEQFKGLSNEEFKAKFKEAYGVNLTDGEGGKLFAASDSGLFAYFKNRSLNSAMAEESGLNKITGAVATRVMGARDGITWHPIRALDSRIVGAFDAKFTAWLQEMRERIKNGSSESGPSASGDPVNDENGKPDPAKTGENGSAADAVNQEAADAKRSLGPDGNPLPAEETSGLIRQITESTSGKVALTGVALVGVACALKGISDAAASLKHDLVVLPLIRMGMQAITVGNQVMSGQDLSLEQLGFFSRQLYSPTDGSWAGAASIQAELGQPQTGPDMPANANPGKINSGGMFSDIINGIPFLGTACKALNSGVGKAFSFAVSLTTPVATIIQTAITSTPAFKDAISGLVKWLAGSPIPTIAFGATFGNFINYGSRLASNDAAASLGGAKLTGTESGELRSYRLAAQKEEISHQSFAERMFDPYSPDSLVSKTIDATSPSVSANMASIIGTLSNPMKIFSAITSPLVARVSAQTASNYDYGFPQVGFSLEDLNSDTVDNPYNNANAVTTILGGSNGKTYTDHAKKCFGVDLGADGSVTSDMNAQIDPSSKDYPDYCADSSQDWTRIRFYVLDMKTAQSSDCFDNGDTTSCQQSGFAQN